MEYINIIFSYLFSFKLWIILCLLMIISTLSSFVQNHNKNQKDIITRKYNYDPEKIIGYLDTLILDALNQYNVINIAPRNIYYITLDMQKDIITHLVNVIPQQISPALMDKLLLVYNTNYINTFLGEHIYMYVVNFVLDFNVNESQNRAQLTLGNDNGLLSMPNSN